MATRQAGCVSAAFALAPAACSASSRCRRGAIEVGAGEMGFTNAPLLGRIAEVAIVAFAVIIAINQIGIAANLVNTLFIGVVAALALAFGLAFGLGGRDVAAQLTQAWYEQSRSAAARVRAHQDETAVPDVRTASRPSTGAPSGPVPATGPAGSNPTP